MDTFPAPIVTVGQLAKISGVNAWNIRRWFDADKLGIECPLRLGQVRAIHAAERDAVLARIEQLNKK